MSRTGGAKTKAKILHAAARLFARNGFDATSVFAALQQKFCRHFGCDPNEARLWLVNASTTASRQADTVRAIADKCAGFANQECTPWRLDAAVALARKLGDPRVCDRLLALQQSESEWSAQTASIFPVVECASPKAARDAMSATVLQRGHEANNVWSHCRIGRGTTDYQNARCEDPRYKAAAWLAQTL